MIIYDIKLLRFLFLAEALFTSSEGKLCRPSRPLKVSVYLVASSLLKEVVFSTYIAHEINLKLLNGRGLGKICRVVLVLAL